MEKISVHIYLNPDLRDALQTEAKKHGLSFTSYAALILSGALDRTRQNQSQPYQTSPSARP